MINSETGLQGCPGCGYYAHLSLDLKFNAQTGKLGYMATAKCENGGCGLLLQQWGANKKTATKLVQRAWNEAALEPESGGLNTPPDNYVGEAPVAYGAPFDEPMGTKGGSQHA